MGFWSWRSMQVAAVAMLAGWFVVFLPMSWWEQQPDATAREECIGEDCHTFVKPEIDFVHIERGKPKQGHTYFFSVGDFGVSGCESASHRGESEESGGDGHQACAARAQAQVAEAMDRLAGYLRPEFVLSLGDNFYVRGVKHLSDPMFNESFENMYNRGQLARVPWKIMMGDHDHRGNVSAMLRHSDRSSRWQLPSTYYRFEVPVPGDGRFLELTVADSVCLEGASDPALLRTRRFEEDYTQEFVGAEAGEEHWRWLRDGMQMTRPAIRIVAAHRPLVSIVDRSRTPAEHEVEVRLKQLLAGAATDAPVLFMHGHDHSMQHWQDSTARLTHVGNGVGGMGLHGLLPPSRAPSGALARGAVLKWANSSSYGFAVHELSRSALNTYFVSADAGRVLHSVSIPIPAVA